MRSPHWPRVLELASASRRPWAVCASSAIPARCWAQRARELVDLGAATGLEVPDQRGHLAELVLHGGELLLHLAAFVGERLPRPGPLGVEQRPVGLDEVPERGLLLLRRAPGDAVGDLLGIGADGRIGPTALHDERRGTGGGADRR